MAWPKGRGRAPGSGKRPGFRFPATISKEQGREAVRALVLRKLGPLVEAQIQNALGISHFMLRDPKTGHFERVTDVNQIQAALNAPNAAEGSTFFIHSKDPQVQALQLLLAYALDKPKEQEIEVTVTHQVDDRIRAARQRLRALSPTVKTLTGLSPLPDIAVTALNAERNPTPIDTLSPSNVA